MLAKSNRFAYVIETEDKINNKIVSLSMIEDYFKTLVTRGICSFYACILHDRDFNADGEIKRPHIHIVFELSFSRADSAIAKDLAKELMININIISYAVALNWCSSIRYLTHLDNPEKYQYLKSDIHTNEEDSYSAFVNQMDFMELDIQSLINIVNSSKSVIEVYSIIGIKNATKYRWLIKDLIEQRSLNRKELIQ